MNSNVEKNLDKEVLAVGGHVMGGLVAGGCVVGGLINNIFGGMLLKMLLEEFIR